MDTLRPPTDNLYKFMAISGVALVIFSAYWFSRQARDFSEQFNEAATEIESRMTSLQTSMLFLSPTEHLQGLPQRQYVAFGIETAELTDAQKAQDVEFVRVFDDVLFHMLTVPSPDDESAKKWWASHGVAEKDYIAMTTDPTAIEEMKRIATISKEYLNKSPTMFSLCTRQWEALQGVSTIRNITAVGALVGVVLASTGFWFWYRRVQCLEDAMRRYELEKAKAARVTPP